MPVDLIGWTGALLALLAAMLRARRPHAASWNCGVDMAACALLALYAWQKNALPVSVLFLAVLVGSVMRARQRASSPWLPCTRGVSFKVSR